MDDSDTQYGHLLKPITALPFKVAGINGFDPIKPFKISTNFLTTDQLSQFHWPSLSELNDDLSPFPWSSEEERRHYLSGDTISTLPVMYTGPPPSAPTYSTPTIPPLSILSRSIIQSSAKLFFISHSIGTNDAREWRLVRRSKNPCPHTHHASKMVIFWSNSTSVILLIHGTMQSTFASGCNTTQSVNFNPHYLRRTHTLFDRLILLRIMPLGTNYFHFVNGLI
jgi:hypothetical protein